MKINLKNDSTYRDFYVVDVNYVPDYDCNSVLLRHKSTGLEVLHLVNDDEENLFSFLFRTPVYDSKGLPHMIEHSVLCGSEKYPTKEPFNVLATTSVKTFVNACTWNDFTGYPASSIVEKDYFNMMDVYADACFFPLLKESTFRQEGHRFEIEKDGSLSVQGVVYNEMKANVTNFYRCYSEEMSKAIHPYPGEKHNSGGDPLEIINSTYEEFCQFHNTNYRPSNCLVFLYGNIPTEKQLDYLADNLIPRLENKFGKLSLTEEQLKSKKSLVPEKYTDYYCKAHPFVKGNFRGKGLSTGVNGNVVSVNWSVGKEGMDQYYLFEYLLGEDSSPLNKLLKESKLGEDIAPMAGSHNANLDGIFSIGLKGVQAENEKKVIDFITEAVKKIAEAPVDMDDVYTAVNKIDFNIRQEYRNMGAPYSFTIMEKCAVAWKYGMDPRERLTPITSFEEVKKNLKEDPEYTNKLIKKYLAENSEFATFVLEPSDDYIPNREKIEKDYIEKNQKTMDLKALKKINDELHEYQEKEETPEELACIPHLEVSDLTGKRNLGVTKIEKIKNHQGDDILLFKNIENTKGIVYFDILFPTDELDKEFYPYLSRLAEVAVDLGWNGLKWDEAFRVDLKDIPNLYASIVVGEVNPSEKAEAFVKENKELDFTGRTWFRFTMNILADKMETAFEKLAVIINTIDFKDKDHLATMFKENISNRKQNFVNSSLNYAIKRLASGASASGALQEVLWGITGYENTVNLTEDKAEDCLKLFEKMYNQIKKGGALVHYVTDEKTAINLDPVIEKFVKDARIMPLCKSKHAVVEDFAPFIIQRTDDKVETLKIDSQVGYATMQFPSSRYGTREFMAEDVFVTWFAGHVLWDKIRIVNGAYGAGMFIDSSISSTYFYSYRDPRPENSIQTVIDALEDFIKDGITQEEVDTSILNIYGDMTCPMISRDKGNESFNRTLYAQTNEQLEESLEYLKTMKAEDVTAAARRILENLKKRKELLIIQMNGKGSGNLLKVTV